MQTSRWPGKETCIIHVPTSPTPEYTAMSMERSKAWLHANTMATQNTCPKGKNMIVYIYSWVSQPIYLSPSCLKHSTPDNKHPLLLPPHPLDNLIRALRQRRPRCIRRRHRIQLKEWCAPRKRYTRRARLVMHLEC
jgi:hypothetical protein